MSSCSTATGVAASSSPLVLARSPSLTLPVLLVKFKLPLSRKKPKASRVRLPEALSNSPCAPSMDRFKLVEAPVATASVVFPVA